MFTRNANANTSVKNAMHACVFGVVVQYGACKTRFISFHLFFVLAIFTRETNANAFGHFLCRRLRLRCASLHVWLLVFTLLLEFALHV